MSAIVVAELHVTLGQMRDGRWLEEPTARYDCDRCGATEGPVTGAAPVRSFVEHVRRIHADRCTPPGRTTAQA